SARIVTFLPACSGTIILTVTVTACGSSAQSTASIPITPPQVTVSGSTTVTSSSPSATLTASYTGASPWSIVWSDVVPQSNLTGSSTTRTVSPTQTTTYTVTTVTGTSANCPGTNSGSAVVTVSSGPLAAPSNVQATWSKGPAGDQVVVTWGASPGADHYWIRRMYNNGNPSFVSTTSTSWTDRDSQLATRGLVTYVYAVVAETGSTLSPQNQDIATRFEFTDDPAVAGSTFVGAVHIDQARQTVDAVRASAGLAPIWAGAPSIAGSPVSAWNFYEATPASPPRDLLGALNQARQALGLAPVSMTAAPAVGGVTFLQHLELIRAGVK
ncbi:MAG: hypothetical protein ABI837_14375, partial [Acidobacteriota bacterium]